MAKRTSSAAPAVAGGGAGGQALADLARRVLRGLAVQVGAGGRRGGRGVGHLAGVGGGGAHAREVHAQLVRHDLRHLGVQALAHLGAAVVHQDGAVGIDVHQRAGLVEVLDVEGDAELHRRQRQAALEHRAGGVEGGDGGAARVVVAALLELVDQFVDHVVAHGLAVGRDVALAAPVEVGAAHGQRVVPERARDAEVGDQRLVVVAADEHVAGLDVTMDHAAAVCVVQRLRALVHDLDDVIDRQQVVGLAIGRQRARAVHMLGHDVVVAVLFARIEDRQDVRMLQHADHVRFRQEHLARHACAVFVVRFEVVHLDRDVATIVGIVGQIDDAGAAAPHLFHDDVLADLVGGALLSHRSTGCHRAARSVHGR